MERKCIAVVGMGAIGTTIAAEIADLDRDELLCCARRPRAKMEVEHRDGLSIIDKPPFTDPAAIPEERIQADWVLLATKAHQSGAARPWLDRLVGPRTSVVVLQNGVDQRERITPLLGDHRALLPSVLQLPAETLEDGRVRQQTPGALIVPDNEAGLEFVERMQGSRTRVLAHSNFATQAWWKLIMNAGLGAVTALTIRDNHIGHDPEVRQIVIALMREAASVGRAAGADLPEDAPEKSLTMALAGAPGHWGSIAVDRREGKPMEWEARNAVIGRLGRRHGIETPLNDLFTALLRVANPSSPDTYDKP